MPSFVPFLLTESGFLVAFDFEEGSLFLVAFDDRFGGGDLDAEFLGSFREGAVVFDYVVH